MRIATVIFVIAVIGVCPSNAFFWGIFRAPIQWIANRMLSGSSSTDADSSSSSSPSSSTVSQKQESQPSDSDQGFFQRFGHGVENGSYIIPEKKPEDHEETITEKDNQVTTESDFSTAISPTTETETTTEKNLDSRLHDRYIEEENSEIAENLTESIANLLEKAPSLVVLNLNETELANLNTSHLISDTVRILQEEGLLDTTAHYEGEEEEEETENEDRIEQEEEQIEDTTASYSLEELLYGRLQKYPSALRLLDDGKLYSVKHN